MLLIALSLIIRELNVSYTFHRLHLIIYFVVHACVGFNSYSFVFGLITVQIAFSLTIVDELQVFD
jgi:hypothetical protein